MRNTGRAGKLPLPLSRCHHRVVRNSAALVTALSAMRGHAGARDRACRDQADRDAISSRLMRHRDQNGQNWADIIDFLTMYPDSRRRVARGD
jgi:hypothetical protein